MIFPVLISCNVALDEAWLKANSAKDPTTLVGEKVQDARVTRVRDLTTGVVQDLNELWNRTMGDNPTKLGDIGEGRIQWEDARFEQPGQEPIKVNSIAFRWTTRMGERRSLVVAREPSAIVRDAIDGTLLFVDSDGSISGDTEKELGPQDDDSGTS
jgi:hypothetical protein